MSYILKKRKTRAGGSGNGQGDNGTELLSNPNDTTNRRRRKNGRRFFMNIHGIVPTEDNDDELITWDIFVTGTHNLELVPKSQIPFVHNALKAIIKGLKGETVQNVTMPEWGADNRPDFGKRPDVRKRRQEIYNRREIILNGRLTVKALSEEYALSIRTMEDDLHKLGIYRK